MYAYGNPTFYIDPNGNFVEPGSIPKGRVTFDGNGKWTVEPETENGKVREYRQTSFKQAVKDMPWWGRVLLPVTIILNTGGDSADSNRLPPSWMLEEVPADSKPGKPALSPSIDPNTKQGRENFADSNPGVTDARSGLASAAEQKKVIEVSVEPNSLGAGKTPIVNSIESGSSLNDGSIIDDKGSTSIGDEGIYERPSKFRKKTLQKVQDEAPRNDQGDIICPTCGKVIPEAITRQTKKGPVDRRGFDVDHYPETWSERVKKLEEQNATREEVLDEFNRDVRAQCPECNQGHEFEGVEGEFSNGTDGTLQ